MVHLEVSKLISDLEAAIQRCKENGVSYGQATSFVDTIRSQANIEQYIADMIAKMDANIQDHTRSVRIEEERQRQKAKEDELTRLNVGDTVTAKHYRSGLKDPTVETMTVIRTTATQAVLQREGGTRLPVKVRRVGSLQKEWGTGLIIGASYDEIGASKLLSSWSSYTRPITPRTTIQ